MVSKNNRIKRMEEAAERQSHFGIRKLTVGAASVLLGITLLFGANAKVARADETNATPGTRTNITTSASADKSDNNEEKDTNQGSTDVHVTTPTDEDSNENTTPNNRKSEADNGENEAEVETQKSTQSSRSSVSTGNLTSRERSASDQPVVRKVRPVVRKVRPVVRKVRLAETSASKPSEKQGEGENPDWYMTDPSKATDENAARKNLEQAIAYAKAHPIKGLDIKGEQHADKDVITVAPDPNKKNEVDDANDAITIAYDNEKDSAQYMQSTANKIWDEIKTYEAYEAERETFMDGLAAEGLYNPKTDVDPTTLSQHLTLDSEPDAIVNLEIKNKSGNWITATKNGLENGLEKDKLLTGGTDLLTIANGADKSDLDAMGSKRGWTVTFNGHDAVKDFIRLTFTNLKNSHYDDGTNAVPINEIVETFSKVNATDGAPAQFIFANDPTRGWWYDHCSGVTATIQLYGEYDKTDKNGSPIKDKDGKVEKEEKLITFNQPVYMSVSSLNSNGGDYKESAELRSSGEAYKIPESSVIAYNTADNKKLYSPYNNNWYFDGKKDTDHWIKYWGKAFEPADWEGAADEDAKVNELGKHIVETYGEWDNPDQYNRIFGSGLYKVNENPIVVRSYVGGSQENQSISKYNHVWFAYSTIIPKTTFDAKHPSTTINYHFAKAINVKTSQTVKFVDDQGNQFKNHKPNTQDGFSFTIKDGKPTEKSHTYNDVDVPVIEGYVADKTRIQDKDGTYVSGPKIIVDKDGGAYVPGQMVTVDNPNVTIEVVYTPVDTTQHAVVNYLDSDEGNKQITTSGDLTGPAGAKIDYNTNPTIDALEGKGYELVRDGFPKDSVFDHDKTTKQTYEVILKHAHTTVTPDNPGDPKKPINPDDPKGPKYPEGTTKNDLTKDSTQTIIYHYSDGSKPDEKKTETHEDTFTRTKVVDKVTGEVIKTTPWTGSHTFDSKDVPVVNGYHSDKKTVGGKTATVNNPDVTDTVTYTPNGKIIPVDPSDKPIPNVPTPTYPTDPNDPTKVVPDEPVPDVPGRTPEASTVTPKDPSKDTPVVYTPVDTTQHAVVNYLDSDEGNKQITTSGDLTGPAGAKIDYNTNPTIDALEGKGYELVRDGFPKDSVFDHDKTTKQTYEVILKHAHTTVTPDNPGDPKKPINPDDPKGPKYPEGTTKNDLTKDSTQTIIYHYSDGSKPDEKKTETHEDTFTRTKVVDKVTGEVIKTTPWTGSHTFDSKDVPVVNGYHSDKKTVGGKTATVNNPDVTDTVTYTPNGKIIPVDPSDKPIPNVPTPTYPTDPNDPTKVVPDEPVPDVPGRTPEASTVTPKDPSKDTPVVYTPVDTTQHAVVNYLDSDEGNKQITTSGDLTGPAGAKIDYNTNPTIDALEGKGYELVRDGFPKDSVFDHDKTTKQTYEVILKHAHTTVTPDNPGDPKKPINPDDPKGPKYPEGTTKNDLTKDSTQTIIYHYSDGSKPDEKKTETHEDTFTRTKVVDKVTGEVIKTTPWTGSHTFDSKDVPVVNGYHSDKKTVGGKTATVNNPDVTDTVTYTPNGKIIPVDPSDKPIPNVPTPTYPTDPNDPTKVVPDEPVPDVPGRTPEASTVTPKDPSKDTPVVYTPVDTTQHAVVNYLDSDEGNKQITTSGDLTGPAGAKIDYNTNPTIDALEGKGYELVRDGFPKDSVFDHDKTTKQTYEVILKHAHTTVTPDNPGDPKKPINPDDPKGPKYPEGTTKNDLTKDSTQTIIYHYSDGSKPDEKKTETHEDTFTRTKVVDKVTGEVIKTTPWTGSHTFDSKDVPVVNGYHSDKKTVGGKTATVNNPDVTDTVTYTPNGKIIPVDPSDKPIPNVPTPTYPTDPNDPTKVVPNEPVPDVPGRTPEVSTVTPEDPSQDTPVVYNPIPNVPGPSVGPSDNTPTPVTPTPGKTTEEKKPEETKPDETKPDENKDDKDVDEPDDDEDVVPTPRHHKKHNGGESSTTRPRPTGYTPAPRGSSYLDANGKVHYKLPQTGESDSEEMAAVLGGAAATIGLIGLAGAKKRRHE